MVQFAKTRECWKYKEKGLKMNYGQARQLLSENATLEKVVTNTGKEMVLSDTTSQADSLSMQKCDVYIKVLKRDCPMPIKDNNSLDMQEFRSNRCNKSCKCKMLFDIWHNQQNTGDVSWLYKSFPNFSTLVENTSQYFMLKMIFYNVNKIDLYDKCNEIIERLSEPCADCLKKKWKDISTEKFKSLRDTKQIKPR